MMNASISPTTISSVAGQGAWPRYTAAWGITVVAFGLLFRRDVAHLFHLWWNTSTFGHCLLIAPILAWLVWQRRDGLKQLAPRPWLPGAGLVLFGGCGWLLGELAGVALVRHAAIVFMLQASVLAIFGLTVARALTFPIFYALFMIPAGEQLVPYLQTLTAQFCILLLDLFEVPAYLDGVFISIPNGDFEVAEACSGVRFLIAMVAFSVLVANVCFTSWPRRIIFVGSAIALSIMANGIRAWGTIYIAHLTTPAFARGVDHVVYGWIFFAVVLTLLMAAGWRFFDRPVDDPFIEPAKLQPPGMRAGAPRLLAQAVAITLLAAAAAPAYAVWAEQRMSARPTERLALPTPAGWQRTGFAGVPWQPNYAGASATAMATYVDAGGQPVDLYLAVFDRQSEGHELVGYGQGLIRPTNEPGGWAWAGSAPPPAHGLAAQINHGHVVRDVWQWYWVNGKLVGSPALAKLEGLKAKLFGGPTRAATVIIAAQRVDPIVTAQPAVARFARAVGAPEELIERAIIEGGR